MVNLVDQRLWPGVAHDVLARRDSANHIARRRLARSRYIDHLLVAVHLLDCKLHIVNIRPKFQL